ncbi:MAG: SDR family oxidoreductase [Cyanobacteria bacterium P01_D01_bin.105]
MKTALITGASSGIGAEFARQLAAKKRDLVLVARSQDKLNQLAEQLQQQHSIRVQVISQDLTEPSAAASIARQTEELGIVIDLLINNAGFGDYCSFSESVLDRQTSMIQLNISALVELTHAFLPTMLERQQGGIINVSSIAGFQPMPYWSVYAASKAFVLSFSEALWAEVKEKGVKVLALCPGPTESNFFNAAEVPSNSEMNSNLNQLDSVENVVTLALAALESGQSNMVTGGLMTQMIANLPRVLPREVLVDLVEKQFRNA